MKGWEDEMKEILYKQTESVEKVKPKICPECGEKTLYSNKKFICIKCGIKLEDD